jgi:hypothetical protein
VTGDGLWPAVHASRQLGGGRADDGGSPAVNGGGVVVGEHGGGPPRPGEAPVRPGTNPSGSAMSMCGARRHSSPAAVTAAIRPGKMAVSRAADGGEGAAVLGKDREGMEKWICGRPLSSIRPEMATASTRREAAGTEREMRASARLLHLTRQHAGVVRGDDGAWAPRGREVGAMMEQGNHKLLNIG